MLLVRRSFQVIFGLLCIAVVWRWLTASTPNHREALGLLGFFTLLVVILGPWWPSVNENKQSASPSRSALVMRIFLGLAFIVANVTTSYFLVIRTLGLPEAGNRTAWVYATSLILLIGNIGSVAGWVRALRDNRPKAVRWVALFLPVVFGAVMIVVILLSAMASLAMQFGFR